MTDFDRVQAARVIARLDSRLGIMTAITIGLLLAFTITITTLTHVIYKERGIHRAQVDQLEAALDCARRPGCEP